MSLPVEGWFPCQRCGESPWPNKSVLTATGYQCGLCRGDTPRLTAQPVQLTAQPAASSNPAVDPWQFNPRLIKDARMAAGLRMIDVAVLVGVSPSAVSLWESGIRRPSPAKLGELAAACGVTVGAFFGNRKTLVA